MLRTSFIDFNIRQDTNCQFERSLIRGSGFGDCKDKPASGM